MNRTIKEATTKTYHYDSVDQLKTHLSSFMSAYNCAKKLSALKRKTPYETILTWWQKQPKLFNINPLHLWMGSYSYALLTILYCLTHHLSRCGAAV